MHIFEFFVDSYVIYCCVTTGLIENNFNANFEILYNVLNIFNRFQFRLLTPLHIVKIHKISCIIQSNLQFHKYPIKSNRSKLQLQEYC